MHGNIGVVSTPDVGSTFWIEIPTSEQQTIESTILIDTEVVLSDTSQKIKGTIVYIEDNSSNQELVEQILSMHRPLIRLIKCSKGQQGLDAARTSRPDLILTDLNLPDIHGSEIVEVLQKDESTKDIPIIVVSADAMPEQIEFIINLGAKAYLSKPISIATLLQNIDDLLS
jgi:CheY-like chemotaxis protein